jgi:hypothetical protein
VGLIVTSVVWITMALGGSALFLEWIIDPDGESASRQGAMTSLAWLGASIGYSLALIGGAFRMSAARGYTICMATAIMALVPFLGPCYVLGIPFGIWALIVLRRADVRAAFQPMTP